MCVHLKSVGALNKNWGLNRLRKECHHDGYKGILLPQNKKDIGCLSGHELHRLGMLQGRVKWEKQ